MEHSATVMAISTIIEVALAPVFLLTGIAAMLSMLTLRLARVVDRWRLLFARAKNLSDEDKAPILEEAEVTWRRVQLITWSIRLSVAAALLICVNISLLFLGDFAAPYIGGSVAYLFVATMVVLILSLGALLVEVSISTNTMKQKHEDRLGG